MGHERLLRDNLTGGEWRHGGLGVVEGCLLRVRGGLKLCLSTWRARLDSRLRLYGRSLGAHSSSSDWLLALGYPNVSCSHRHYSYLPFLANDELKEGITRVDAKPDLSSAIPVILCFFSKLVKSRDGLDS